MVLGVAAVERVLRALADHARRGHVPAGLAEHAVVQQDARDALAARRGVEHLLQALVHHVAVALQREHERVGQHALHAGRDRRRAPVQRLHEVDVHRARERRVAADAGDADRARRPTPSSSIVSRNCRTASGSPQPGHMWCSCVSSRSGFCGSTMRARARRGRRVEHGSDGCRCVIVASAGGAAARSVNSRSRGSAGARGLRAARGCARAITSTSSMRPDAEARSGRSRRRR